MALVAEDPFDGNQAVIHLINIPALLLRVSNAFYRIILSLMDKWLYACIKCVNEYQNVHFFMKQIVLVV